MAQGACHWVDVHHGARTKGPCEVWMGGGLTYPVPSQSPGSCQSLPPSHSMRAMGSMPQSSGPDGGGFADLGLLQLWFSHIGTSHWVALPVVVPVPRTPWVPLFPR